MGKIESVMAAVGLLMRLKGISQAELARRAGMSPSQLSRYLSGQTAPQFQQITRLIDGLTVSGLAFWWTVYRVEKIERALLSKSGDEVLQGVLRAIVAGDGDHEGAAKMRRLLDAARHSTAANQAILDVLADEARGDDERDERGPEPD
jgi:transcriptional regulator with XRE-family HTH domain